MSLDRSIFLCYCYVYMVITSISYLTPCAANPSAAVQRNKESIVKFYTRFNNISTHEVDLVFVLDRSASVSRSSWQTIINFVRSLLEHFTVDNRNTRVAIVTYSTETSIDINDLGETFETKCSLMRRVQRSLINKPLKGYTATHDALVTTRNILYSSRKDAKKAVFVLTDGKSNIGPPPVRASVELRSLHWDRDWDSEINGPQLEVFALGVHNAEMSELDSIASPLPNHTYHIPDFSTFRQLARSLHQDEQSESWVKVKEQTQCQISCSEHADCMCGTKSGDAVCICKAGYEGDGHICTACPKGYYKDGIFPGTCKPCPSHSTTSGKATTDQNQCQCVQRYYRKSAMEPCQLQTCPDLPEIQHGAKFHVTGRVFDEQLTGDSGCLNTPDSSCHYRCERGYRLTGHPALVCEANGTWTGQVPLCQIIDCGTIDTHGQSVEHGEVFYSTHSTTYGSTVRVECDHGWRLIGDTVRTCTHNGIWSGTQAWCVEIRCSRLPSVVRGQVTPSACVETTQKLGQDCNVTCDPGYDLQGAQQFTCTANGNWSNDPNVTCVDIEPPTIVCPNDMVVPITQGNFTIVHWKESTPIVEDNSGKVNVKVTTLIQSPARLTTGYHEIEFEAEDGAGNTNVCTMVIQVVEKTVHITFCPENVLIRDVIGLEQAVSWPPPVFVDNQNQTLDYRCSRDAGSLFPIGKHNVYCTSVRQPRAAICSFSIELIRKTCDIPPAPKNGVLVCRSSDRWLQQCSVMCNDKYDFYNFPQTFYKCGLDGQWILRDGVLWPDCSATHFSGNAFMEGDYEYFYYHGDCEDIKTQIVEKFYSLVQMHSWDECGEHVCTIGEVMVTCGKNRRRRTVNFHNFRRKRDIPMGITSQSDIRTSFSLTSEIPQTTSVTTVIDNTSTNSVFPETSKRGRKHVSVHFGVNVTSLTATTPRRLARTLLRLQRRLRGEIQNNDIDFSIVSEKCSDGFVMKKKSHSIGVCVACPVGRYHQRYRNTCLPCPVGSYQDREGKLICVRCPQGKSTRASGSSNLSDCRAKCEEGHYSSTGLEPCFQCDEGTYQENAGQTICEKCPGNTTTATSGARNEHDCKDACEAGTYNNLTGFTPCVPCPQGTFQPLSGMTSCVMCPANLTTSNSGSQNIEDCENIDFCAIVTSKRCLNRGTCVNLADGYTCHCDPGYTGVSCEVDVDDCSSQPCSINATCLDGVDNFVCVCPPNRRGRHCEVIISPCESMPCTNGGSCVETAPGQYQCFCPYMYQGSLCEEYNACASQPCYNGDCQIHTVDNYTCSCHRGYVGRNCEVIDLCQLEPCLNGGECTLMPWGFQCSCTTGHTGHFCERTLLDLCSGSPCGNNGNCYTYNGEVKCKCCPAYAGKACQDSVSPDFDLVFGKSSTTDYVMLRPVFDPASVSASISSLTICLWMRSPDKANYGTPFSYSAYSNSSQWEESNMLTLTDYGQLKLLIHGNEVQTDIEVNDGNWHHICLTWKSVGGLWNIYINGSIATSGDHLSSNTSITSNGYFVIGQEQDVVGGAFSSRESFVGEISQLNFFDRVLSEDDVKGLANQNVCNKTFGNIVAWTDVTGGIRGKVEIRRNSHCLDVNECLYPGSYNCSNQRECRDIIGGYQCAACLYGYQGDDCNQPINECDMNVCHNEAMCIDGPLPHDFLCKCRHGFTGSFCEVAIDFCTSSPCQNNGTCFRIDNGYRCVCSEDNSGINCEHTATKMQIPASCQTSSCLNNGTCTPIPKTSESVCVCSPGFRGLFCEINVNGCEQKPCQNEAECVGKEAGGYQCLCRPSWKGRNCEISFILDCSQSPCLSNGTCINEPNSAQGYRCHCPVSSGTTTWGPNCERNLCESNPCLHNGTCVYLEDNSYKCLCQGQYTGDRCDIDLHGQLSTESVVYSSPATESSTVDKQHLSTGDPKEASSKFPESKRNSLCDKLYCEHGGTCQQISEDRAWCICLIDFTGQDCSIYRKRVTSKFDVSLVIKEQYNYFYEEGWLFKSDFGKQVRGLYRGMLQDDKIQVRNVHFRPGKDHDEMVASFQLIYTKYLDTNTPALTSREINQVMQDTVKSGYLGNLSVSKLNLTFQAVSDELRGQNGGSVGNESTLSYMIGGVVILTVSLGTIITVLCVKMKKFRYSYRKTSRLLHHLNNSNDMGLNLITNPVFDGISDRIQPHGEETSCSNMYAELGDMMDPYCVTSKADLREEGLLRRQSSVYSSKRSNKDCNIERERCRKNSEFSDTLSDSSKKTNTSFDTSFTESEHHHSLNKNEFTQQTKKDTKELLPSFGKHGKIDNTDIVLGARNEAWYENSDASLSPDIDHSSGSLTFNINPFSSPSESEKINETPPPSYATVIEEEETDVSLEFERPKCATPNVCVLESNNENNFLYDIPNTYIMQGSYSSVTDTTDITISPAVDQANFIYSSPLPEDDDCDKVVYFSPLPSAEATNGPDKKFSFSNVDITCYSKEKIKDGAKKQEDLSQDSARDCSDFKKKESVSVTRKDSASQTDYVDMDNGLLLDKVVHWRRRKIQNNPSEIAPQSSTDLPATDTLTEDRQKEDDGDYVEPNHPFVKSKHSGTKVRRKDSASQTDYIDMDKKNTIRKLRRGSENTLREKDLEPCRRKSMDDYLEVLPDKLSEEKPSCSTLPRTLRKKDMSRRKLPPLPKDPSF